MLLTFGILSLFVGGVLIAISVPRLLIARSNTETTTQSFGVKLLIAGFILLCSAVFMIHEGQARADSGINFGILLFFGGMIITAIGAWLGFWGPLSSRNTTRGLQFILLGILIIVIGILALSNTGLSLPDTNHNYRPSRTSINWSEIFSHKMGPIPFGLFCLAIYIGANGIALKNKLHLGNILGTNLVVSAMLLIIYAMGAGLFESW